jgi:hypothetical protein
MPTHKGGTFTPHFSALEFEKLSYVTLSFRPCTKTARRIPDRCGLSNRALRVPSGLCERPAIHPDLFAIDVNPILAGQ